MTAIPLAMRTDNPRPAGALLAGVFLLAVAGIAYPFSQLDPYPATLVCGFVGTLGLGTAIWIKYRGRMHLNAELAFLIGITIQYLIAPTLSRITSSDFGEPGWYGSAERADVKAGYGIAMVMVLLFCGLFMLTSALIPGKRAARYYDGRLALVFTKRSFVLFGLLAAQVWMVRGALLATGSYYHVFTTRFMFEDPRYSGWAQISDGVGPVVVAFLWAGFFSKNLRWGWAMAYTLMDLGWHFASGSREKTLMVGIVILLTYIVYRNRMPWKTLAVLAIPVTLLVGFMDYYRYAIQRTADVRRISTRSITDALSMATRQTGRWGILSTIERGMARFNDLDSTAAFCLWVPRMQPYEEGETYARIPASLVPRALWPEKPKVIRPINEWFFHREGGQSPVTTVGEGYLNFGVLGVVLAGIVGALLLRLAEFPVIWCLRNVAVLPVYVGLIGVCSRLHTQPFAIWVTSFPKAILFAFLVYVLTKSRNAALAVPAGMRQPEAGPMEGQLGRGY